MTTTNNKACNCNPCTCKNCECSKNNVTKQGCSCGCNSKICGCEAKK